ncbi:hydroxyethylthiazole kinase [Prosthecomicrobium sp. N25]|uniref:hydroxyethylthiazole kinase n=1 Tax=Prosthecomicrobium sp. N25 TaxID=3129254 RepID=UPI00307823C6
MTSSAQDHPVDADRVAATLEAVRARRPRVQVITNPVAQTYTANMLLAVGAAPSMTSAPEEIAAFIAVSGSLLVNLGILDRARREASLTAVEVAREMGVPWVLDPVKVDISPPRLAFATHLLGMEPDFVRANHAEFVGFGSDAPGEAQARAFAVEHLTTLALSGPVDIVTDGRRLARVGNGHPMMDRVTAMGCAGTAVAAAFRAVEPDALVAATAALVVMGIAGEVAAETARGPGSFAIAILDALYGLDADTIRERARLS